MKHLRRCGTHDGPTAMVRMLVHSEHIFKVFFVCMRVLLVTLVAPRYVPSQQQFHANPVRLLFLSSSSRLLAERLHNIRRASSACLCGR